MGKTVETYRRALEREFQRWSGLARALRKEDRTAFNQMIAVCRSYASAGSNATRLIIFESIAMSIFLHHQKALNRIEKELDEIRKQRNQR